MWALSLGRQPEMSAFHCAHQRAPAAQSPDPMKSSNKYNFEVAVYHFSFMLIIVCSCFPKIEAVSKGGFPW